MAEVPYLSDTLISRIAREVARNIYPVSQIRETNHLSIEDWDDIVATPIFQQRLKEEIAIWNAPDPMSATKRIGAKALTLVEECMPEVFRLIHDPIQPMAAKIDALKWAARMGGVEGNPNVKPGDGDDNRIKITINIGTDKLEFDKERALPPKVIDSTVVDLSPETVR